MAIGVGLLLLAAAGGDGGDEDAPQITTLTSSGSATRRFEETLSLPMCSPTPPADGNEQPCRVPL